jgi:DNA-binding transcriptional LysR family regulator
VDEREMAAFRVLAEELSFSRAAVRIGLTQPALSLMLARIEAELGVRLFDRTKRRVQLTPSGQVFLAESERTLEQIERLKSMTRRAGQGLSGRATIGFVEAAAFTVLPALVARIRAELPGIELVLREMVTADQMEALDGGRIDIGLLRPMFSPQRFHARKIFQESYVFAVPAGSPLAARAALSFADVAGERLIANALPKRRYIESRFRGLMTAEGLGLPVAHEVSQIHAVIALVAGGLGIAIVPQSTSVIRLAGVLYKPIARARQPRSELMVAWRRNERSAVVERVVALARPAARPMSGPHPR